MDDASWATILGAVVVAAGGAYLALWNHFHSRLAKVESDHPFLAGIAASMRRKAEEAAERMTDGGKA